MAEESCLSRNDEIALIIKIAQDIYTAHVSSGRAHVSIKHALRAGAIMVGVAQSEDILSLVDLAKTAPNDALADLRQRQVKIDQATDADQEAKIRILASEFAKVRN